jgi:hypothetical protein
LLEILKQLEKFVVYSEGTLYSSISLLKIGRDIMPTPQGLEGYYAYFSRIGGILCLLLKDLRDIMPTYRCKNPLAIEE